jgi:threonine aldolase
MIDLRSDTVTRPTAAMRRAMAEAEVGDDVYGEDPTVNRLEQRAAELLGKEAGLFVPTGTMGNVIAVKIHTEHGQEVVCESRAHLLDWELSMTAWFAGCLVRSVHAGDGILRWEQIRDAVRLPSPHWAPTGLIEIENTHNMAGGTVYDRPHLEAILDVARRHHLPVHFDGARVFNAAVALGVSVASLAAGFDSLNFCLSKGLGAPVGSLLCGPRGFIADARRVRKMFGGGMRQIGILAAAGRIALRDGPARLPADHENAARLAHALAGMKGIDLDPATVRTNIVIFRLTPELCGGSSLAFLDRIQEAGVLGVPVSRDKVRLITHRDVDRGQIDQAIERIGSLTP